MDARQSRRGKRISKEQEKRTASDLGGRTQAASGATRLGGGGDVRVIGKTRVECKYTEKKIYVLKYSELRKLRKQAIKTLESPVFQFAFRHPSGRLASYAVIPWPSDEETKDGDHNLATNSGQVRFTEAFLDQHLLRGRIKFTFEAGGDCPSDDPVRLRTFEVLRWRDYVEKMALHHEVL